MNECRQGTRIQHAPERSALTLAMLALALALLAMRSVTAGETPVVRGFVLTDLRFVLPGAAPGDCPQGFNQGASERLLASLPPAEREQLAQDRKALYARLGPPYHDDPSQDPCASPAAFPDGGHHTIDRALAIDRIEAGGSVSHQLRPPARCAAGNASRAIDNQYWRVMGCVRGYQPGGLADSFADGHITDGSMTVLLELRGPAPGADGEVEIAIASSDEPVLLGTDGKPLARASFTASGNSRYHNRTRGRIVDGVLTSEPFDLRLVRAAQRLASELVLRDARLRLELHSDGSASGLLGGYWELDWLAHASIRIQDRTGLSSGNPAADAHGYSCPGKYRALQRLADGHPDPATGACTTISTLHRLAAVPAFVLWPEQAAPGPSVAFSPPD
jgi:hypothetical protein